MLLLMYLGVVLFLLRIFRIVWRFGWGKLVWMMWFVFILFIGSGVLSCGWLRFCLVCGMS